MLESELQHQFIVWAKAHAIPLTTVDIGFPIDDLYPLKDVIDDARVVAFGESMHMQHEFLALRNRLFMFFVEEMGFTAIAVESGFTESIITNDYVSGGNVDRDTAVRNVFTWGAAATKENLELIEWIRQHNAKPTTLRKVKFYGIDLTGGEMGQFIHSRWAIDAALAYIEQADTELARKVQEPLESFLERFNDKNYIMLTPGEREKLTSAIHDLVEIYKSQSHKFLSVTSDVKYQQANRNAKVAQLLDTVFRFTPENRDGHHCASWQNARDAGMADNVRWVLEREGPEGRILLFAHNVHVSKLCGFFKDAFPEKWSEQPPKFMGEHLHEAMGGKLFVIGSTFNHLKGAPEFAPADIESIDGVLSLVGNPLFFLNLRQAAQDEFTTQWLNYGRKMRVIDRYGKLNPVEAFDVLVLIDTVREWDLIQ